MFTRAHTSLARPFRRFAASAYILFSVSLAIGAAGCSRFHHEQHDVVYVSARQMYLHDRVAAVSNRVAEVVNGQQLEVIEHGRRFLKVKTAKNEIGWIEQHAVIDAREHQAFEDLASQHKQDPVVAAGTIRDDIYLHIVPGRETEHFYLLAANAKVELLARASIPKAAPGEKLSRPASLAAQKPAGAARPISVSDSTVPAKPEEPPPVLEDWWLVRDTQARTGWLLASRVDVDVPDSVAVYSEGQRMVGAYEIAKVTDPEATTPDHQVPEYVTLLSPQKAGLPFDFDQVRVFTWSLRHHRYETAFRLHPIAGFYPLKISAQPVKDGTAPAFSFQIANSEDVSVDPTTGISRAASPRTLNYEMIDTQVKRIGPDMGPIPIMHSLDEKHEKKEKKKAR
ncbi:MAG: SH3 domain-containing protein [Terracidiphilus sp.]